MIITVETIREDAGFALIRKHRCTRNGPLGDLFQSPPTGTSLSHRLVRVAMSYACDGRDRCSSAGISSLDTRIDPHWITKTPSPGGYAICSLNKLLLAV